MPKGVVKTRADEEHWAKAKARVREEYGLTEDDERFWRLVNGVYQRMRDKKLNKAIATQEVLFPIEKRTPKSLLHSLSRGRTAHHSREIGSAGLRGMVSGSVASEGRKGETKALSLLFPVAKSWGDAHVPPIANAPHRAQRADSDLLLEAANTTGDAHVNVYALYRRLMGHAAKPSVKVQALESDSAGTLYRLDDGAHILRVYQAHSGPARLVKAITTHIPAANIAWTALREAGYEFRVKDREARIKGSLVRVKDHSVWLDGPESQTLLRVILEALRRKQTSEAWVGGHQQWSTDQMTAKPW